MNRPIRLLLDATCVNPGEMTGAARYVRALVAALQTRDDWARVTIVGFDDALFCDLPPPFEYRRWARRPLGPVAREEARRRHVRACGDEYDVVHWTLDPGPAPCGAARVLTLFDLARLSTAFLRTQRATLRGAVRTRVRYGLARRMDGLVTTTRHAAREITASLGYPAEHVTVSPIPVDPSWTPGTPDAATLARFGVQPDRYVLFVGQMGRQKNEAGVYDAFKEARSTGRLPLGTQLVLCGDDTAMSEELRARAASDANVVVTGRVEDRELLALYRGAACTALPSFYEGFGLPVLEAMACGTPCVVSDVSSLPEIAGDAAALVSPTDTAALAQAFVDLSANEVRRREFSERGIARAAEFSSSVMAERHVLAYRKAMERRG